MRQPDYQINRPVQAVHQRRYRRHLRQLAFVLLVVLVAAAVFIYEFLHVDKAGEKSAVGPTYSQHIAGPQTFTSSYFQFSSTDKWQYAANDSTASKLTYLLYQDGVPAHLLSVYVNQVPLQSNLAVTHVLPVHVVNDNSFTVSDISQPCGTLYKPANGINVKTVSMGGTSFLCVPDSQLYTAVVGQVGGDYNLKLKRSGGQTANYIIYYQNLSFSADPDPFVRIMGTFKAL